MSQTQFGELYRAQVKRKDRVKHIRASIDWCDPVRNLRQTDKDALAEALEHFTLDEIADWICSAYGIPSRNWNS